jgi:hypothetical protein
MKKFRIKAFIIAFIVFVFGISFFIFGACAIHSQLNENILNTITFENVVSIMDKALWIMVTTIILANGLKSLFLKGKEVYTVYSGKAIVCPSYDKEIKVKYAIYSDGTFKIKNSCTPEQLVSVTEQINAKMKEDKIIKQLTYFKLKKEIDNWERDN